MSPAKEDTQEVALTNVQRAAATLEVWAKAAYEKWAYRVGVAAAWEYLPDAHRRAWREVVQLIQTDAECDQCGEVLLCVDCDAKTIYECPQCAKPMDCLDDTCPGMAEFEEEEDTDADPS